MNGNLIATNVEQVAPVDLSSRYSSRKQYVSDEHPVLRYIYPSYSDEVDQFGDPRTVVKIVVHNNNKPLIKPYNAEDYKISNLIGAGKVSLNELRPLDSSMQSMTGGFSRLSAVAIGDEISRMSDPTPASEPTPIFESSPASDSTLAPDSTPVSAS